MLANDSIQPISFPPVPPVGPVYRSRRVVLKQKRLAQGSRQMEQLLVRLRRRRLNPRRSNSKDFPSNTQRPSGFDALA